MLYIFHTPKKKCHILSITSSFGCPLKIENATLEGNFRHFNQILSNDLLKYLLESLMLENMGTNSRFGGLQNSFRISTTIVEQLDILYPSLINRRL